VELTEVIRRRHMVRAFDPRPVGRDVVDELLDLARRAPSAGNTQGWGFLVLDHPLDVRRFWDVNLPGEARERFRWQGLLDAPVLVLPLADREAYLARYGEPDKAATGLADERGWSVPYWLVDTAFATMALQLAAVDAGLGTLFFGLFDRAAAVKAAFEVPDRLDPLGVLALGHPATDDGAAPGRSASRPRRPFDDVVRRGRWGD
jgi:nitroreductase